jgi:hypothetical protein
VDRAHGSGGPRAGGGSPVHGGPVDGARPELAGVRARRRSRARDLAMAAWGARGEDEDPYLGWREWVEGLGRPGIGEGRWWWRDEADIHCFDILLSTTQPDADRRIIYRTTPEKQNHTCSLHRDRGHVLTAS